MKCPFCGTEAAVPTIDIGVGMEQCGPAECPQCDAAQDRDGVWREADYWRTSVTFEDSGEQEVSMESVEEANRRVGLESVLAGERMMAFFRYGHLPEKLQEVSRPFCELATWITVHLPSGPERTVALRKLLESKDCAVRTMLGEG